MIHGETITVIHRGTSSVDDYGQPIEETTEKTVNDVLVCPSRTTNQISSIRADGKVIDLVLHFPKTFTDDLTGCDVVVRGVRYHIIGTPLAYTNENTPTRWNRPAECEVIHG